MLKSENKKKGTVTYLSDIVVGITTIFTTLFMLFVTALVVFLINTQITSVAYGEVLWDGPVSGAAMNSILDYQYGNFQIKDLLADAVWFGKEKFPVGAQTEVDLKQILPNIIKSYGVEEYTANLEIGSSKILLGRAGIKAEKYLKCSEHKIFAGGKTGLLKFCMSGSR